MGHEPGDYETSDCVADVVAMEVNPTESYVEDPNGQSNLTSRNFLKDEWLNQQYVDCEDASLSGVPAGPRAVNLLSSDIEKSLWEVLWHWPWSLEVFLEHYSGDESRHAHRQVL